MIPDPGEVSSLSFKGPFSESSQYKIELPLGLVDGSGRELANASRFPMTVTTGEFPPLAKFSARFGIIEEADPLLPVTVRNLEAEIAGNQLKLGGSAESSTGFNLHDLLTRVEATLWRVPQPKAGDVLSKLAGQLCSGVTDERGRISCEAKPPITGGAILRATVTDDSGNSSSANSEIFIPGNEREWLAGRDDDRMDFLPEQPA